MPVTRSEVTGWITGCGLLSPRTKSTRVARKPVGRRRTLPRYGVQTRHILRNDRHPLVAIRQGFRGAGSGREQRGENCLPITDWIFQRLGWSIGVVLSGARQSAGKHGRLVRRRPLAPEPAARLLRAVPSRPLDLKMIKMTSNASQSAPITNRILPAWKQPAFQRWTFDKVSCIYPGS